MKLTNRHNIHPAIIAAIDAAQKPRKGPRCIGVTTLIAPAQIHFLKEIHEANIIRDYSEMMAAFFGTALHAVIEGTRWGDHEVELSTEIDGWTVTGHVDLIEDGGETITDWKTQTVWKFMKAGDEHEAQLNCYAWLARKAGYPIKRARTAGIIRDWQKREAASRSDYPASWYGELDIHLWPDQEVERFVRERLTMFESIDAAPECTDEERWTKPEGWAVKKPGAKRALRIVDDLDDALELAEWKGAKIEHRPAEFRRCEAYCDVAAFCSQYANDERRILTNRERLGIHAAPVRRERKGEGADRSGLAAPNA